MLDTWQVAAASIMGRHHRLLGKNRQDAHCHAVDERCVAIAVTDGCGSAAHSEIGAYFGAREAVAAMRALVEQGTGPAQAEFAVEVGRAVISALDRLCRGDRRVLEDAGLFTLVAACTTRDGAVAFAFGDGAIALGDDVHRIDAPDNAPDYLAYALLTGRAPVPTLRLAHATSARMLVATDGCAPLDLATVDADPRVFTHGDALRRALATASLDDDATLIVAKRSAP